ncbi:iron ABC transporter permease [Brumimicrobium glaciale]|uniref:Iron ABC transporter permease n=1 Tax=Brumimicrobium glaciale TaxID=200475 RepID=A0A4Q4KRQ8_9FLAO|nr:iron ABC transporter permease [Brumimicrobium glaciale]RYM36117.1 iron ABC transporter permease [Brumimicrobium glaciale]
MNTLNRNYWRTSAMLFVLLISLVLFDLTLGSFSIGFSDIFNGIFNYDSSSTAELTVRVFRFPRVITAVLAGGALSIAGLLMQTLFQNPLAGPYVLGINSGSSLLVAISTMSSFYVFGSDLGIVAAAMIGAFGAGLFILFCSIYVKSKVSLLLIGIMFGSFAGALVSVIQAYADPNNLKTFMLWSFGSLQGVEFNQLGILTIVVVFGALLSVVLVKPLNLLLLGDKSAALLGVNVKTIRFLIICATAILTGVVTAFCGPIAFVGLVVPNMVKMIYKTTNHYHLLIGSLLGGALLIVICDITMQLIAPFMNLPLNALTALVGAPVVMWIIMKKF